MSDYCPKWTALVNQDAGRNTSGNCRAKLLKIDGSGYPVPLEWLIRNTQLMEEDG